MQSHKGTNFKFCNKNISTDEKTEIREFYTITNSVHIQYIKRFRCCAHAECTQFDEMNKNYYFLDI